MSEKSGLLNKHDLDIQCAGRLGLSNENDCDIQCTARLRLSNKMIYDLDIQYAGRLRLLDEYHRLSVMWIISKTHLNNFYDY